MSTKKRLLEEGKTVDDLINECLLLSSKYSIKCKIDRGSISSIYSVEKMNDTEGRKLIAKSIPQNLNPIETKFFKQEIKAMDLLNDKPWVPKLYDLVKDEKNYYLILDKIEGQNGFDYLAKKDENCLSLETAKIIFTQLVDIVAEIHKEGIAHRDLKLENFMVTDDLKVYLIDFGLCKLFDPKKEKDEIETNDYCGSLDYMSPQILDNKPYSSTLGDVFSLGIILNCMITGYAPFTTTQRDEFMKKKRLTHPPFVLDPDIPKLLQPLIKGMLAIQECNRVSIQWIQTFLKEKKPFDPKPKVEPFKSLGVGKSFSLSILSSALSRILT